MIIKQSPFGSLLDPILIDFGSQNGAQEGGPEMDFQCFWGSWGNLGATLAPRWPQEPQEPRKVISAPPPLGGFGVQNRSQELSEIL